MLILTNEFEIGDIVFLITDAEQKERMVTGLYYDVTTLQYRLSSGSSFSYHFSIEISKTKIIK